MFAVLLDDDQQLVEGLGGKYGVIDCWDKIPKDKRIKAVYLTDGGQLLDSLSGFDYYVVCYEGTARASMSLFDGPTVVSNSVDSQVVYGVRSLGYHKSLVQQEVKKIADEIDEAFPASISSNVVIARVKALQISLLQKKVSEILSRMETREVSFIRMGITRGTLPISEFDQDKNAWREGLSDPDLAGTREEIAKELSKYADPTRLGIKN